MDLILRGYPSKIRFAEWQKANSLPPDQLPRLSGEQAERARTLRVPERAFAIALKASELAAEEAVEKMERVGRLIQESAKKRIPDARVKAVVWDFVERRFRFMTQINGSEHENMIPIKIIDDLLMEKPDAEQQLKKTVDFLFGGWDE